MQGEPRLYRTHVISMHQLITTYLDLFAGESTKNPGFDDEDRNNPNRPNGHTSEDWFRTYMILRVSLKLEDRNKHENTRQRQNAAIVSPFLTTDEEKKRPDTLGASGEPSADPVVSTDNMDQSRDLIELI